MFTRGRHTIYSKRRDKGFTLVELIIAVAIAGIVTVSIFEIFSGVVLNWKKAENRMAQSYKLNNLYILLSKKLDELYQYKSVKDPEKYFEGKEDSILFISYYSVKVPYFPVTTRIYIDSENNLVMEETPFFFDRPDADVPEPVKMVLWKDIKDFKLSYLVVDTVRKKGGAWKNEYIRKTNKPQKIVAIKMEVFLKTGDEITVFSYLKKDTKSGSPSGGLL